MAGSKKHTIDPLLIANIPIFHLIGSKRPPASFDRSNQISAVDDYISSRSVRLAILAVTAL